ncbi:hypothetical protein [Kitasatospora xanthocidica]|nr:hypothetical protein [Kitasatospora xanthocidica]
MSSSDHRTAPGMWPACGHEDPTGARPGPGAGRCIRLRGHRERADGTGPLIHHDGVHEWEQHPDQPWWAELGLGDNG